MNRPLLNFVFQFVHDGSSSTITVNLASSVVSLNLPAYAGVSTVLAGPLALTAVAVVNPSIDPPSLSIVSTSLLAGICTFTLTGTPPAAGTTCLINGTMLF